MVDVAHQEHTIMKLSCCDELIIKTLAVQHAFARQVNVRIWILERVKNQALDLFPSLTLRSIPQCSLHEPCNKLMQHNSHGNTPLWHATEGLSEQTKGVLRLGYCLITITSLSALKLQI